MYRVLAARSLKFLEQRQEDTASYQRQYKAASKSDHGLKGFRTPASPKRTGQQQQEEKENLSAVEKFGNAYGEGEDYHARLKETSQGGPFHPTYPDKIVNTSGSYARQAGERVAQAAPMLGYPPKPSTKDHPAIGGGTSDNQAGGGERKPHATIIVHEKRDKSDQLNLRIATSVERQKLRTYILVDDVVQKRLHKKVRKELNTSSSLAKLRGSPNPTQQAAQKELVGVGVWSQLGSGFNEQGAADLDLPIINYGVPLRELTKSKLPRPPPLKESSEHRKKYEALVELFRTQRHKVIRPHPRDGQDGVPRPSSSSGKLSIGQAQSIAAAMNAGSTVAWDVNPLLSDVSISDENITNPANQSLIARLYQTQNQRILEEQQQIAAGNAAFSPTNVHATESSPDGSTAALTMKRSASSASSLSKKPHSADGGPQTSVERIAALQPRKVGWDASSVRQLASSASVPNFERRPGGIAGSGASGGGLYQSQKLFSGNIQALPDDHPAQSHPSVLPSTHIPQQANAKLEAAERERAEKEERRQANMQASLGKSAIGASSNANALPTRPSSSQAIALANAAASAETASSAHRSRIVPTRVKWGSGPSRLGLVRGDGVKLHPDHPEYLKRKQELFAIAEQRRMKKRMKAAEAQALADAVQKQLDESRLDHLHRWRNAFDGTKQKLDRILIQRLCQRAEIRARNLEGGPEYMEPLISDVLHAQQLTESRPDPAWEARLAMERAERERRREWAEKRGEREFVEAYEAVYDEHRDIADIQPDSSSPTDSDGQPRHQRGAKSQHYDLQSRQQDLERQYHQSVVADPSTLPQHFHRSLDAAKKGSVEYAVKTKNTSGQQQSRSGDFELSASS